MRSRTAFARQRGKLGAAGAALALALAGCGGDDDGPAPAPAAEPLGKKLGGSVATLVNCGDWKGGTRERKLATIADIRRQLNRDDSGIKTPPLSDAEAMQLFNRECGQPYAQDGFRLYVMYARAAGWAPLLRARGTD